MRPKPVAIYLIDDGFCPDTMVRVVFRKSTTKLISARQGSRFILTVVGVGHGRTFWYTGRYIGKECLRVSVKSYLKFQRAIHLMRHTIAFQYPYLNPHSSRSATSKRAQCPKSFKATTAGH